MQKLDRNQEKPKSPAVYSIATRVCPRCGSDKTRRSSTKASDRLIRILFFKSYRCQACRFRFWALNSFRLYLVISILLLLIPFFGLLWMDAHETPEVIIPDETVSNEQIKRLADKGDPEAELQMGLRNISLAWAAKSEQKKNDKIQRDKFAVQWFKRAADHGQVEAQYRYGLALLQGQGIVQDYKTAFYWMEKAAQQGHALAQFNLGEMYHNGMGIKSDEGRAYLWYNLSAAQGIEIAVSKRDYVLQLLNPDLIAAMQEEANRISGIEHSEPLASQPKVEVTVPVPAQVDTPLTPKTQGTHPK